MNTKQYGIVVGVFIVCMFIFSFFMVWKERKDISDELIVQDVVWLADIFTTINNDCVIIDFDHQKNYIDFLTVESFEGSEVGSMNLTYADKWQGPYVEDNPTIQEQYYQVVRTNKGHFIVPGPGVTLSNGKVIGTDILLNEDTDIQALIDQGTLQYKGKPLAVPIQVGKSD